MIPTYMMVVLLALPISVRDCGYFDTVQLGIDIRSGYFERAGIEMAKSVITDLALQLECEREVGEQGGMGRDVHENQQ